MTRARIETGAAALVLLLLAAFCAARMQVTNEITHFLPSGEGLEEAAVSRALADSELTRTYVVTVASSDVDAAIAAAREIETRMRPHVAWIHGGSDPDLEREMYDAYFPARFAFLSPDPSALPRLLSDEGLAESARELKETLAGPGGALVSSIVPADPWLAFPRQLRRALGNEEMRLRDGRFLSREGTHAVLLLGSRGSPFDTEEQRALLANLHASVPANASLDVSGLGRHPLAVEESIRADVTRISLFSTLGGVLLFGLLFRSLRNLGLMLIPLAAGMLGGMAACLLLFGKLHGITLAFGASLIGVAIDYPIHLFNEHALHPDPAGPAGTLRRLWRGILLGACTTIAGFAGMAWTTFPGIREIAVFAPAGILAALLATRFAVPHLMSVLPPRPTALQQAAVRGIARVLAAMRGRRAALLAAPALALVLCAAGLPSLRWIDDPKALTAPDPALAAEDERVRERVTRMDAGRFVIASGPDFETALQRNDAIARALESAREAGELEGFRSLHSLLWSAALQEANLDAVHGDPTLASRAVAALVREGFREDAFADFRAALARRPEPLDFSLLHHSAIGTLTGPFHADLGHGASLLTFVRGVKDPEKIRQRLAAIEGARWFDQPAFLRRAYGRFRTRTFELAGFGLVAVLALVVIRYRRWRPAVAAFVPALIAAASTFAALSLAGVALNLLHLVGLLLVLSMGVDYGIFVVEARERNEGLEASLLGTAIACATTVLSFGLMGLSSSPALQAIGITTAAGSVASLLLAPTTLLLLERG